MLGFSSKNKSKVLIWAFVAGMILTIGMGANAFAASQSVSLSPSATNLNVNDPLVVTVSYNTDTPDSNGIGIKFFFNSSVLTFNSFSNFFTTGLIDNTASPTPADDTANEDGNANTDKVLSLSWADLLGGAWPGAAQTYPLQLVKINFTAKAAGTNSPINVTRFTSGLAGSTFTPTNATVSVTAVGTKPTVTTTSPATAITQTGATVAGNVTAEGTASVTDRGICVGTTASPTTGCTAASPATGAGAFTVTLSGLTANTGYFARAYATSTAGTSYGADVQFTTLAVVKPTVTTTSPATAITSAGATVAGNVTSEGSASVTARGICVGTTASPTTNCTAAASGGAGAFTVTLSGLTANTGYFARAYATSTAGTSYGADVQFTTAIGPSVPTLTTTAASAITATTATTGGNVTVDGGSTVTARGVCVATTANPVLGGTCVADTTGGTGTFTVNLTGLTASTLYHIRAYATNTTGTGYGSDLTFTTACAPPTITSTPAAALTTGVDAGTLVTFGGGTATSTWTFGDTTSNTATGAAPTHTYATAGVYTVKLTSGSCSGTATVTVNAVDCSTKAKSAFTATPTGLSVVFAIPAAISGNTYSWTFGDTVNNTSTLAGPTHVFSAPGTYTVSVTASEASPGTCKSTSSQQITVACATNPTLTADKIAINKGESVNFTLAGGTMTQYSLDFADGSTPSSGTATPTAAIAHTYSTAGTFTATATATIGSCKGTAAPVTITVADGACNATNSAKITSNMDLTPPIPPVAGQVYTLKNATTGAASSVWTVTDLKTNVTTTLTTVAATDPTNPAGTTYAFPAVGDYLVSLTTVSADTPPCTSKATQKITVPAAKPKVVIVATPSGVSFVTGTTVQFSNQNVGFFSNPDWAITDATSNTVLDMLTNGPISYNFSKAGTYTLTVQPLDTLGIGDQSPVSMTITITDTPPTPPTPPTITSATGAAVYAGQGSALRITGTNLPTPNPKVFYAVNTTGTCPTALPAAKTEITVATTPAASATSITTDVVTIPTAGNYCVFICDSSSANCVSGTLSVSNAPVVDNGSVVVAPSVAIDSITGNSSTNQITGIVEFTVKFASTSTGAFSYLWDFGDGETSTEVTPTHVYKKIGLYTVKLTITGLFGMGTATKEVKDFVKVIAAPTAKFTCSPTSGVAPLAVTCEAETISGATKYSFDFGDNQPVEGKSASHTFTSAGTFTITLTVTYDDTAVTRALKTTTATATVVVTPALTCDMVTAVFTANPTSGNKPLTVNFDASASANATGYAWTFGDNQSGNGKTASHSFATVGTYTATLTVTNSALAGCQKTATQTIKVNEPPCEVTALFTADKLTGDAPLIVKFDATASMKATSFAWTFGDTATASGVTAEHKFDKAGTYTVTLTAKDDICTKTATQVIQVMANDRPSKPILLSPDNGITARVPLTPTLKTQANYSSPVNSPHAKTEWQIAIDADFKNLVFDVSNAQNLTSIWVPDFMLMEDTKYYWRARFIDNRGYASDWASPFTMLTVQINPEDVNGNGVPESQELTDAKSDIDGNGVADMKQTDAIFVKMDGKGSAGIKTSATNFIGWLKWIDVKTLPNAPAGYDFPWGAMTSRVETKNIGDSAVLTVYFSEALPAGAKWFNYNQIEGWKDYSQYAVFSADRKVVTLTLKDGGIGDADGVANGAIVDPAIIGIPTTTPAPAACLDCDSGGGGCFINTVSGAGVNAASVLAIISMAGIYFSRRKK